jgi:hypothetical protein
MVLMPVPHPRRDAPAAHHSQHCEMVMTATSPAEARVLSPNFGAALHPAAPRTSAAGTRRADTPATAEHR